MVLVVQVSTGLVTAVALVAVVALPTSVMAVQVRWVRALTEETVLPVARDTRVVAVLVPPGPTVQDQPLV